MHKIIISLTLCSRGEILHIFKTWPNQILIKNFGRDLQVSTDKAHMEMSASQNVLYKTHGFTLNQIPHSL